MKTDTVAVASDGWSCTKSSPVFPSCGLDFGWIILFLVNWNSLLHKTSFFWASNHLAIRIFKPSPQILKDAFEDPSNYPWHYLSSESRALSRHLFRA